MKSRTASQQGVSIAIVDDDKLQMHFYVEALSQLGYTVTLFQSPKSLISRLNKGTRYDLYIVDLMIPSKGFYSKVQTSNDFLTGAILVRDIRERDSKAPILVITNMGDCTMLTHVKNLITDFDSVSLMRKPQMTPSEFAGAMGNLIEHKNLQTKRSISILKRLMDGVILQPNFCGVGIDLKALFKKRE